MQAATLAMLSPEQTQATSPAHAWVSKLGELLESWQRGNIAHSNGSYDCLADSALAFLLCNGRRSREEDGEKNGEYSVLVDHFVQALRPDEFQGTENSKAFACLI